MNELPIALALMCWMYFLQTFGLEIGNPPGESTHSRGAALDLVIAFFLQSPQVVESVHVQNHNCACASASIRCPLLVGDHFALEVHSRKNVIKLPPQMSAQIRHVRDWGRLLEAQVDRIQHWSEWPLFSLSFIQPNLGRNAQRTGFGTSLTPSDLTPVSSADFVTFHVVSIIIDINVTIACATPSVVSASL